MSLVLDEISFVLFILLIMNYIQLFRSKYIKGKSRRGFIDGLYNLWVETRMKDENPITSVQAIRNIMIANSTFISSLFILLGLLVGFYEINNESNSFFGIEGLNLYTFQTSTNIILILFSMINFILGIRMLMRTSTFISIGPIEDKENKENIIKITKKSFTTAQKHWMLGIRGFFFLISSLTWYIHSIIFIISTICTVLYLIKIDIGVEAQLKLPNQLVRKPKS